MKTFIDKCTIENNCLIIPKHAILDIADASFQGDEYDIWCLLNQIGDEIENSNPDGEVFAFLSDIASITVKECIECSDDRYRAMKELENSQIVI